MKHNKHSNASTATKKAEANAKAVTESEERNSFE